ncbi:MAG: hypothetical protein OEM84_08985 [Acidimicrobiia bacterium]|nr:hypothetical protein [Acidimicrobiia bacterium]
MESSTKEPLLRESADRLPHWVVPVGIGFVMMVVFIVLNPVLIFTANTPSGGDMGAHVLVPAYLRDTLLPEGRILGWSDSWFGGFPIFYFYFPLSALVTVLLDVILPYGVAFKLVTIVGLLALPAATYFLVRAMNFARPTSLVAAAAGGSFVFMESFSIYGGNIPSTLAGEFSFSWSFALALVYLGLLIKIVRDERKLLALAGLVLALTALTHLITTLAIILASLPILVWKRGAKPVLTTWVIGFSIAGFWAVPLLARVGYSADMAWVPLRDWKNVLPVELWWLLIPALFGLVWSIRRTPRVVPFVVLAVLPVIYYWLVLLIPEFLPESVHQVQDKLWNGRFLPFFYFGVFVFAGLAVGHGLRYLSRRLPEQGSVWWVRGLIGVLVVVAFLAIPEISLGGRAGWVTLGVGLVAWLATLAGPALVDVRVAAPLFGVVVFLAVGLAGLSFIPGWARWNYSGYEGKEPWPEYEALMVAMSDLPPGRVQWEYSKDQNKYGTPMALMLLPYWTEGSHPSMEGLFFESSLTTPFHFLNQAEMSLSPSRPVPGLDYHTFDFDRGLEHLALYDVRYYVTYTEEAQQAADSRADLRQVGVSPPFSIYELPPSSMVEVAAYLPAVLEGGSFDEAALDWYGRAGELDEWLVEEGPDDWPRVGEDLDGLGRRPIEGGGVVSDVVVDNHEITFRTTAVGIPHLIKVSYFPNWKAEGAEGPFRAAPALMVVVPTEEDVSLEFRSTWAEQLGMALSIGGLLFVASTGLYAWRRSRA